jgi:Excalibur calcium-binding domain/Protein of unknown function (DUF1524)
LVSAPTETPLVTTAPLPTASPAQTPTPTPDALEFTDEAAADPVVVETAAEGPSVVISDATVTDTTALALLATIPVKGKAPKTGYDRAGMFGSAWLDVDRNGCDTRNDILARDLTALTKSGSCKVLTGLLEEPYTGTDVDFVRGQGTSQLVQIDHVVALMNAWQTGAQQLTQPQRVSFANDPLNLLAVDGRSNAQKGAGDAATWLPANKSFRCDYVARQVSVKATYGLWMIQAEHDAISRILATCPDQPAVTSAFAPEPKPVVTSEPAKSEAPAPKPEPAPAKAEPKPEPAKPKPAPEPAPVDVYYKNCTAAREAGAAPVYRGDPGYAKHLDRDGDGIGCE